MLALLGACNQPPEGGAVSLTPELPTTEDTLSIVLEDAVDPNRNDEVGYAIVWQRDGVEVTELADLMEIDASQTAKGETWEVFVTPSDGKNDKGIGETFSASVVIGNAAPTLTNLAITPTSATASDALGVTFDVEDPDDDTLTVTYSWSVDGAELSTTDTLDSGHVHQDEITVTVTVDDGEDGIVSASASLTVANSAPTAPVAVVTPDTPSPLKDILCEVSVESTDVDGESIDYAIRWEQNGSEYTGAATTTIPGDTVLASATAEDDVWTCIIDATDGTATVSSEPVSVEVTGLEVLVLWDTMAAGTPSLVEAMELAGLYVTLSTTDETAYDGTNPSLDAFDAVLHMNGTTYSTGMPESGQQALVDWVEAGGTFVHGEWNAYETLYGSHTILSSLDTLVRVGGYEGAGFSFVAQGDHPTHAELPETVTIGEYCGYNDGFAVSGATVLWKSEDGTEDFAAFLPVGDGMSIGFAVAGNYQERGCLESAELQQMYINAIAWGSSR
jgi:hypothetical protein